MNPRQSTPASRMQQTRSVSRTRTPNDGTNRAPRSRYFTCPTADLVSMFRGSRVNVEEVKDILKTMKRLQERAGTKFRFHFFMETELGEVQSTSAEVFGEIATRLMFSPTISPYNDEIDDELSLLMRVLNSVSSHDIQFTDSIPCSGTQTGRTSRARADYNGRRPPPRRLFDSEEDDEFESNRHNTQIEDRRIRSTQINVQSDSDGEDAIIASGLTLPSKASWPLYIRENARIPNWFPFSRIEYTTAPQRSSEILYVENTTVALFQFEDERYTKWVYREFFRYIHNEARRRKVKGLTKGLKYSDFTPPWIRARIVKGVEGDLAEQNPVFLAKVAVTDTRDQRSTWGVKRLAYLLGAFYQEEPEMSVAPLDHLLSELRALGEAHRQKSRKRRLSSLPGRNHGEARRRLSSSQGPNATTLSASDDSDGNSPAHVNGHRVETTEHSRRAEGNTSTRHQSGGNAMLVPVGQGGSCLRNRNRRFEEEAIPITSDAEEAAPLQQNLQRNLTQATEPTGSASEHDSGMASNIMCAAGTSCRFKDSIIFQSEQGFDRNGITGRCRECKNPLHDLCGGGEEGHMLCPTCRIIRSRREISLS